MKPLYLKFVDEAEMNSVLLLNGFYVDSQSNRLMAPEGVYLDIIGIIPGKYTVDSSGNIISQEPNVPGWHVNLLVPDDYAIQPPTAVVAVVTPVRKWAGY